MLRDFMEYMITVRHCFSCKHFKSNFNRYNSFDYGTCNKLAKYYPYEKQDSGCNGKEYQIDKEWNTIIEKYKQDEIKK